jgi:hypothetical protein
MFRRSFRSWSLLALPLAFVLGACTEDLETGAVCPALCPGQGIVVYDTVLTPAYVYDSTLVGFPNVGLEAPLLLARRGDTLDVRAVIRFDTLMRSFRPSPADTLRPIVDVDSAFLVVRMKPTGIGAPTQWFVDVYDVFAPGLEDSILTDLIPLFTPARLMGTYEGDETLSDTVAVRIPLDSAYLRAIIADTARRLRLGLQVRSADPVQIALTPYDPSEGNSPFLQYKVAPDTTVGRVGPLSPFSETPEDVGIVADDYTDYSLYVTTPNDVAAERFTVGGLPAARVYLRFDLPLWLTDSVGVLKAELELTQDPVRGMSDLDTLSINTHLVLAGTAITEERRAATLLSPADLYVPTRKVVPSDTGLVTIALGTQLRRWRREGISIQIPQALVLRSSQEGASPLAARFFGFNATDPTLRPRLRVSYTPNTIFGRP